MRHFAARPPSLQYGSAAVAGMLIDDNGGLFFRDWHARYQSW
jgi:hypothetical protein